MSSEVVVGGEDPHHDQDEAGGRQDRAEGVEGPGRIGRDGIDDRAAQQDDHRDDHGLEDEGRPPADRGGDETADQRSGGGADAAHPGDHPEGPGTRRDVAEEHRREDVDGRDQQGGADPFEDRVAEDEDAETRRDCAHQRADPVDGEADREAPLAAPPVGQLAAGDHEGGHHQQEHGDRDLYALHGRVEVLADVGDHHVHVRAGEAADELRERERNENLPQSARRPSHADTVSHVAPYLPIAGAACTPPRSSSRFRCDRWAAPDGLTGLCAFCISGPTWRGVPWPRGQ